MCSTTHGRRVVGTQVSNTHTETNKQTNKHKQDTDGRGKSCLPLQASVLNSTASPCPNVSALAQKDSSLVSSQKYLSGQKRKACKLKPSMEASLNIPEQSPEVLTLKKPPNMCVCITVMHASSRLSPSSIPLKGDIYIYKAFPNMVFRI